MDPALNADLILALHALIVAFVVLGLPLTWLAAWRGWALAHAPWFRLGHLGTIGFVIAQTWLGQLCPLTVWENQWRAEAGQTGYGDSFIAHWLGRLIYVDSSLATLAWVYTLFGLAVLATFWWVPIRWPRR